MSGCQSIRGLCSSRACFVDGRICVTHDLHLAGTELRYNRLSPLQPNHFEAEELGKGEGMTRALSFAFCCILFCLFLIYSRRKSLLSRKAREGYREGSTPPTNTSSPLDPATISRCVPTGYRETCLVAAKKQSSVLARVSCLALHRMERRARRSAASALLPRTAEEACSASFHCAIQYFES